MAACVIQDSEGYLKIDSEQIIDNCSEYLLINSSNYLELKNGSLADLQQLFTELFVVTSDDISLVSGFMIVTFVVGHGVGRFVKTLGKHS